MLYLYTGSIVFSKHKHHVFHAWKLAEFLRKLNKTKWFVTSTLLGTMVSTSEIWEFKYTPCIHLEKEVHHDARVSLEM